jgi:hypothetical protein
MQRFLAFGHARIHVLQAGIHDPSEAQRIVKTLDGLAPKRLWFDIGAEDWPSILAQRPPGGLHKRSLELGGRCGAVSPFVVYRQAHEWAIRQATQVAFVGAEPPPPRRLDLWRLDRMLKREGFESATPTTAVQRLHLHYISRIPRLAAWVNAWCTETAQNLVAAMPSAGAGGVLIVAAPHGDVIADHAQAMPKP